MVQSFLVVGAGSETVPPLVAEEFADAAAVACALLAKQPGQLVKVELIDGFAPAAIKQWFLLEPTDVIEFGRPHEELAED